jgi:uncharacterized membrane protein YbhN (UPF0104 family)
VAVAGRPRPGRPLTTPASDPKGDAPLEPAPRRGWIRWAAGLVPFVGLIVAIGVLLAWVDVREVAGTLASARLPLVLAAAGLALCATAIVGLKLYAIVRIVEVPRRYSETWSAVMAGLALNAVLPARGGDLVRALFLAREPGTMTVLLGAVLLERLYDVATLGSLVVVASLLAGAGPTDPALLVGLGVVGAAATGGGLLAVLGPKTPFRPDLGERLARAVRQSVRHPLWASLAFGLSALAWLNNATLMLVALRAVGAEVPAFVGLRAALTAVLAGVAPVSVSGIGTRDATLVVMLGSSATPAQAAAGGLLYTALIYWFLGSIGMFALGRETTRALREALKGGKLPTAGWDPPWRRR